MADKTYGPIDLREYHDLDLDEITLRKTTTHDSLDAAGRCLPAEGGIDANMFHVLIRVETIFGSIVSYRLRGSGETKSVTGTTCVEAKSWGTRTREFVGEAFDYFNGMEKEERDHFRKKLAGSFKNASGTP